MPLIALLMSLAVPSQGIPALGPTGDAFDLAILKTVGLPDDGKGLAEHLRKR